MAEFDGQAALVTGAGSGIGRATAADLDTGGEPHEGALAPSEPKSSRLRCSLILHPQR